MLEAPAAAPVLGRILPSMIRTVGSGLAVSVYLAVSTLVFSACSAGDRRASQSPHPRLERISMPQALDLIRSCEASTATRLHSGGWSIALKAGQMVHVPKPDHRALQAAATKAMKSGCKMGVGME